jgi:hypothetical protein
MLAIMLACLLVLIMLAICVVVVLDSEDDRPFFGEKL